MAEAIKGPIVADEVSAAIAERMAKPSRQYFDLLRKVSAEQLDLHLSEISKGLDYDIVIEPIDEHTISVQRAALDKIVTRVEPALSPAADRRRLPDWVHPKIDAERGAVPVTMGELGQQTAKVIGQLIDDETPAVVTRHGRSIALIIPLEPGSVESSTFEQPLFLRKLHEYSEFVLPVADQESDLVGPEDLDAAIREAGGNPG